MNSETTKDFDLWCRLKECAKNSPDRIALEDSVESLTFHDLVNQVEQFASSFVGLQQQFDYFDHVPLFVTRDLDSAVAVLGCYLLRLPFVPIDAQWPNDRIELILNKLGGPKFLLAGRASLQELCSKLDHFVNIHSTFDLRFERGGSLSVFPREQSPSGMVLFTSGSTGVPKGVEWDRDALDTRDTLLIERKSKETLAPLESHSLLGYPLNWTAGIYRLLGVAFGERVRVLSLAEMAVPQFANLVQKTKATTLRLPSSLLALLADLESNLITESAMPSIRSITTGGDALSFSVICGLKNLFSGDTEVQYAFGATEATSELKFRFLLRDTAKDGPMPIGESRFIAANMKQYLDEKKNKFIYLSRGALATGYFDDPDLTERRFLFDDDGSRYWFSGDILQEDSDGLVWHKGRVDDLVKIRGKLTSPSEAREALQLLDGVKDAVVLAVNEGGTTRLIAHLAFQAGREPLLSSLKSSLAASLPPHLMPSKFIAHQSLPKTPQGKADRAALLSGEWQPMTNESNKPPRTNTEMLIFSHLQVILGVEQLSVEENLIDAGLDSLAALELEVRLQSMMPLITMDLITSNPTVRSLASALDGLKGGYPDANYTLNPNGITSPIFAFPGDGGHMTQLVHLARALGDSTPVVGLLNNQDDALNKPLSIEGVVSDAQVLVEQKGTPPFYVSGYSLGGIYAYELSRALVQKGLPVNLVMFDTSFSHMTPGGDSTPFGRLRLGSALRNSKKKGLSRVVHGIFHAFKAHGFLRASYLMLISQPLAFWLSISFFRNFAGGVLDLTPKHLFAIPKAAVFKAAVRHEVAKYSAIPFTAEEAELLQTTFVYSDNSTDYRQWIKLIPNIGFFGSSGSHLDMLKPPHVGPLVEGLREGPWKNLQD